MSILFISLLTVFVLYDPQLLKETHHLAFELPIRRVCALRARHDHDIISGGESVFIAGINIAQAPSDEIPRHGLAHLAAYRKAYAVVRSAAAAAIYYDIPSRFALSVSIEPAEFIIVLNSYCGFQGLLPSVARFRSLAASAARAAIRQSSVREFLAAFRAAAGKYLAAVLRGHSLSETVLLGTLTLLGLISAKHVYTPLFSFVRRRLAGVSGLPAPFSPPLLPILPRRAVNADFHIYRIVIISHIFNACQQQFSGG